jgi:hypothetical protein
MVLKSDQKTSTSPPNMAKNTQKSRGAGEEEVQPGRHSTGTRTLSPCPTEAIIQWISSLDQKDLSNSRRRSRPLAVGRLR